MARSSSSNMRGRAADIAGPRMMFIVCLAALLLIGLVMVYSASSLSDVASGGNGATNLIKQAVFAFLGLFVLFVLWKVLPLSMWRTPILWIVFAVCFAFIVLVAVAGTEVNGARRWIDLGVTTFQPSEFCKISLVLVMACLAAHWRESRESLIVYTVKVLVLVGVPTLFIFLFQSDLGTAVIIAVGVFAVLWFDELPLPIVVFLFAAAVVLLIFFIFGSSYRSSRLLCYDPWNDGAGGLGDGYQFVHSYYAFAQGGIFGVGLGNSSEKFLYLPMADTDFIFSVIGEELGMVGCLVVMALFIGLLVSGLRIARSASSHFAMLVAASCTVMLVFQAFLNMGCAMGAFPSTGKPLPFISYGGSSMVASLILAGLVLQVSEDSSADTVHDRRRDNLRVVRVDDGRVPTYARRTYSDGGRSGLSPAAEQRRGASGFGGGSYGFGESRGSGIVGRRR